MSQTLNTASSSTGLLVGNNIITGNVGVADNVTTGSISIGSSMTSGGIDIGTGASMTGSISIGSENNTGNISLQTTGDTNIYNLNFPSKLSSNQSGTLTSTVTCNSRVGRITTVTTVLSAGTHIDFQVDNDKCLESSHIVGNAFPLPDRGTPVLTHFYDITNGSFKIRYYLPKGISSTNIRIQFIVL